MIDLYNALKIITLLFFIQKILTFNLGVAFLKSVSILNEPRANTEGKKRRRKEVIYISTFNI